MKKDKFVIGVDYGTDSCRAVLVHAGNGQELASSEAFYPRWKAGKYCDPQTNSYRQHPLDYIESLEQAVRAVLSRCPEGTARAVCGLAFDTTGSTPVLLNKNGVPLALLPEYAENPNAMFILWKDHTAVAEAAAINALAKTWPVDYTAYSGGVYSSEWVWSKVWHVLREDPSLRPAAYSWAEHCDWMPALLTGRRRPEEMIRSRCAAGHKAMWNVRWGGLPSEAFLTTLDPVLDLFKGHLYPTCHTSDTVVGCLTPEWAGRLGLPAEVIVTAGLLDCHAGAIGAGIGRGTFVRVMGTSTCDIMVASYAEMGEKRIGGICGQVDGSVLPGWIGLEAGQSAFGDVYAWLKKVLSWPAEHLLEQAGSLPKEAKAMVREEMDRRLLPELTREAEKLLPGETSLLAVDWLNGRRTPMANQTVKGMIGGLTLGTTAPQLFRALVEATAFGSRAILESFLEQGIPIDAVTALGGISLKSPFVMQTLADVLGRPIRVAKAGQACALGAAMSAATAAGLYPSVEEAQQALGQGFAFEYRPDLSKKAIYDDLYARYLKIGRFTERENLFYGP